jgi:hypothetical protein
MELTITLVGGAILGSVVSLAMAAVYQERWSDWIKQRKRLRAARATRKNLVTDDGAVRLAAHRTALHLIEGDGDAVIEPALITISVQSSRVEPPLIVARLERRIARQLQGARPQRGGSVAPWNSPHLIALKGYRTSRKGPKERISLHLDCAPTTYAAFAATVLSLDTEVESSDQAGKVDVTTLRRCYFPTAASVSDAIRKPLPFLANGVGVALLAFTDDNQVILTRRGTDSRARPGQRDVSVVEGTDIDQDSMAAGRVDPYLTAVRGCREELGVTVGQDEVRLLALAVDTNYYQWSFLGLVDLRCSVEEALEMRALHAKDRWEGKLHPVLAEPARVFEQLKQDGAWDIALVTAYLAFCQRVGVSETRRAATNVFGSVASRPGK